MFRVIQTVSTATDLADADAPVRDLFSFANAIAAFVGVAIMQWPLPLVFAVLAPISVACAWMTR